MKLFLTVFASFLVTSESVTYTKYAPFSSAMRALQNLVIKRFLVLYRFSGCVQLVFWTHSFFILSEQDPERVLSFAKSFIYLWCRGVLYSRYYILMKVFSLLSLTRNLTVSTKRGYDNTHFLYSYVAMPFLAYTPYYPSVGSCNRLFFSGFCQNLVSDKRKSAPHFLCLYIV